MSRIPAQRPGFSIVMPTYRRRDSLRRVLEAVARQAYPADRLEVLVISDGGDDGSVEMVRELAGRFPFALRLLEQANQGPAAARNRGVAEARGPFVLFLDDDVVPGPDLVFEHLRAHGDDSRRVVMGPLLEPPGRLDPWVRWEARGLAEQYDAMDAGVFAPTPWQFYTGNASVRLDNLRRAGGFDPGYRRAEDIELGFRLERLGCSFVFNRRAAGLHIAERSYASWLGAAYQYGRNDVLFGMVEKRILKEWRERHPLTRRLAGWAIRHRRQASLLPPLAWAVARSAQLCRLGRVSHVACSAIFNLHYWLGATDEMGLERAAGLLEQASRPIGTVVPGPPSPSHGSGPGPSLDSTPN